VAIAGLARMQLASGDHESAWAAIRGLLDRLPPNNRVARADILYIAVVVAHAAGDIEQAQVLADELRGTANVTHTESLLASSSAADAVLASPPGAVPLLVEAVRHFNTAGLRFDEAHTRLLLVEALLASGDKPAAQRHLALATEVLTELAADDDLAQARQLATAAGEPVDGPLSSRELEVLRLVAQGLSNPEIAVSLVLSEHTVHRHVANILTKLDQSSRTGAASYAIQAGLL